MKHDIDKILHDKLHDYRFDPPEEMFGKIERSLAAGSAGVSGTGAGTRRRLWSPALRLGAAMGTAAAVALAVLLLRPAQSEMEQLVAGGQTEVAPERGDAAGADLQAMPKVRTDENQERTVSRASRATGHAAQRSAPPRETSGLLAGNRAKPENISSEDGRPGVNATQGTMPDKNRQDENPRNTSTQEDPKPQKQPAGQASGNPYGKTTYSAAATRNSYNPIRARKSSRTRTSASLYAANFGGGAGGRGGGATDAYQLMEVVTRSSNSANDDRGVAYNHPVDITSADHHLPVSIGAGVAVGLTPRLSLETGINYTALRSDLKAEGFGNYSIRQQLHYLGVPVALMWRFADLGPANLYLRGGGMLEKGIKGTWRTTIPDTDFNQTEKIKMTGLLPSLNASLGLQVDLGNTVGLYLEPGINYYPSMDGQPQSYRSENPLTFGLRAGLRFNFGR